MEFTTTPATTTFKVGDRITIPHWDGTTAAGTIRDIRRVTVITSRGVELSHEPVALVQLDRDPTHLSEADFTDLTTETPS